MSQRNWTFIHSYPRWMYLLSYQYIQIFPGILLAHPHPYSKLTSETRHPFSLSAPNNTWRRPQAGGGRSLGKSLGLESGSPGFNPQFTQKQDLLRPWFLWLSLKLCWVCCQGRPRRFLFHRKKNHSLGSPLSVCSSRELEFDSRQPGQVAHNHLYRRPKALASSGHISVIKKIKHFWNIHFLSIAPQFLRMQHA